MLGLGTIKFLLSGNHSVNQRVETSELYRGRRSEVAAGVNRCLIFPRWEFSHQPEMTGGSGACGQERRVGE